MITGRTTFVKACKDFFALEGSEMVVELKALTMNDRVELHAGLAQAGYDLEPLGSAPAVAAPALVGV